MSMKKLVFIIACLASFTGQVTAQQPGFPQVMPPQSVYGRSAIGTGPGQAIPFSILLQTMSTQANTWTALQTFNKGVVVPPSGQFYENNGAIVNRFNDRAFFGGATLYNQANCCAETGTWLASAGTSGLSAVTAQVYIANGTNSNDVQPLFVAEQSLFNTNATTSNYPITATVVNNNASYASYAWLFYGEAYAMNSTVGGTSGIEIEVRNVGGIKYVNDPFHTGGQFTLDYGAGCGAGQALTTNNCSGALLIFPNKNPFDSGIVFSKPTVNAVTYDSIAASGPNSERVAISQPAGYSYCWYSATVTISVCEQTASGFFTLTGASGQFLFAVQSVASAVNYVEILPGTTGNGPTIQSVGTDTNPNLLLEAQGAGSLIFASPSLAYVARTVASATSATLDDFSVAALTTTITGTTGITTAKGFNKVSFYQPTYTDSSSVTITNAATVYIENAPAAAGSVTITNPYALWVNAGAIHLPGVSTGTPAASLCLDASNNVIKKTTSGACV